MTKIRWKKQADIELEREHERKVREHEKRCAEAQNEVMNMVVEQFLTSDELSEQQKEKFLHIFPLWQPGQELGIDDKVVYEGNVYRVIQKHTSQVDWLPSEVPALYAVFYQRTAEDDDGNEVEVIPDWVQPLGSHDAYGIGDKVMFDGKVYESVVDGNVWSPGVHGWKEVAI